MEIERYFEYIVEPFKKWFEYIRINHIRYYLQLLKINVIAMLAWILPILVAGLLLIGIIVATAGTVALSSFDALVAAIVNMTFVLVVLVLLLLVYVLGTWLQSSVALTSIIYTDKEFNKTEDFSIMNAFGQIKIKVLWFLIADFLISTVLFIPGVVIILVGAGGGAGLTSLLSGGNSSSMIWGALMGIIFSYILLLIYTVIVYTIYHFFIQFWKYGFILGGLGVIESLKRSVSLVRGRFWESMGFGVLVWVGGMMVGAPLIAYSMVSRIGFEVLRLIGAGNLLIMALLLVALFIHLAITLVLATIVQAFTLPSQYLYWKKVDGERQ